MHIAEHGAVQIQCFTIEDLCSREIALLKEKVGDLAGRIGHGRVRGEVTSALNFQRISQERLCLIIAIALSKKPAKVGEALRSCRVIVPQEFPANLQGLAIKRFGALELPSQG